MKHLLVSALFVASATAAADGLRAQTVPMTHDHMAMGDLPATDGPGYKAADVRFYQGMISHHAQAITMSKWAPTHGAGAQLLKLAQKIDISQTDEIAMMKSWLNERRQAAPNQAQIAAMMMPGMLTPEQMARLDAARGTDFDRLYLTFMIQHHQGALAMAEELFASPGAAQDSDVFRFVSDVYADQSAEIDTMMRMLDAIPEG